MSGDRRLFGRSVTRLEDGPLLTGKGKFLDDLRPAGCLAAAFLRSPHAHAAFTRIDADAARRMPGVIAVLTIAELRAVLRGDRLAVGLPSGSIKLVADRPILAIDEVTYVGEPVALVVAESRAVAEDAAERIEVDYDPLPVVADCRDALLPGAPVAHRAFDHNCVAEFGFGFGDTERAFAGAAHVVAGSYSQHRGGGHSLEGRGVLALPDSLSGVLRVWSSTQTPQALKKCLCELLAREDDTIRVTVPDLGGGFGPKLVTYPEEIAVAAAALLLDRPVKWVEDRREHFLSSCQERDQFWDMEMALDGDGRILGIRGTMVHDHGAYTARGVNIPYGSGITVPLPYNVPAYRIDIRVALTNKVPVTPVRGAGQPQGVFVMERLLDKAAAATGLDRAEIRARNIVRPEQMPCEKPMKLRGGTAISLDSGDFPATQARAMQQAGWAGFAERQAAARRDGRQIGIGLANYVEATGRGPYESVKVRVSRSGRVMVTTAATAMGQGTVTMIAQIVGDALGCDLADISVTTGDSDEVMGFGGFNSRQTVIAGISAHKAANGVRDRLLQVAGHMMETDAGDLEIVGNSVALKGVPGKAIGFAELAAAAAGLPGYSLPGIREPGIVDTGQIVIDDMTYSNGCGVAEVEVDPETGHVRLLRFTLAHDCGRMVNPAMVEGQLLGGIAHGLGNALFEQMLFDTQAQPVTTTFADYLLVSSSEMPRIDISHTESPSPLNALGLKGVGESGVIPSIAAIISAVDDALSDLRLDLDCAPLTPQALRARIAAANKSRGKTA
jgi:carbon-monoxide dehydrogenase large subunit